MSWLRKQRHWQVFEISWLFQTDIYLGENENRNPKCMTLKMIAKSRLMQCGEGNKEEKGGTMNGVRVDGTLTIFEIFLPSGTTKSIRNSKGTRESTLKPQENTEWENSSRNQRHSHVGGMGGSMYFAKKNQMRWKFKILNKKNEYWEDEMWVWPQSCKHQQSHQSHANSLSAFESEKKRSK